MIIPKEDYDLNEDIITIIYGKNDGSVEARKLFFNEYTDERLTLSVLEKYIFADEHRDILNITVLAENPLNGRVMRYDRLHQTWTLLGNLRGYA